MKIQCAIVACLAALVSADSMIENNNFVAGESIQSNTISSGRGLKGGSMGVKGGMMMIKGSKMSKVTATPTGLPTKAPTLAPTLAPTPVVTLSPTPPAPTVTSEPTATFAPSASAAPSV